MEPKRQKDYITEEDYTLEMSQTSKSAIDPQEDSPGDSEADAGAEFEMGLHFSADDVENRDEPGDKDFGKDSLDEESVVSPEPKKHIEDLPDSAKVVFSEQPSPWRDIEHSSDTN